MKEIMGKLDFIKIKNVCFVNTVLENEKTATDREKTFAKDTCDKGLVSKIYNQQYENKPTNP